MMKQGKDYPGVTVVFWCHDGEGNVFLNKRSSNCKDEHGCWDCGGGGLELGERVESTLRREIKEEYGTDVFTYEFLGFRDVHRRVSSENTHWIALDFKVLINREKAHNAEPHKFDDVGWFRKEKMPTPLHSQFPEFLDKYYDRL